MKKVIIIIIFMFFAFAGFVFVSNIAHEYSHKQDFKSIAKDGSICLFEIGGNKSFFQKDIANYNFKIRDEDELKYEKIRKYTEYKAYGIDFIIFVIFLYTNIKILNIFLYPHEK